jgi:hypothetical protein
MAPPTGIATMNAWEGFEPTPQAGGHYGTVVASAGDINGDGCGDIAVATGLGNIYVYFGSRTEVISSQQPTVLVGETVAGAGDVNNDGFGDLIIGQPSALGGQGQALLMLGSLTGLVQSGWAASDSQASHFGRSVASAGDVNGDGFGDVIVGATDTTGIGRVYVYLGDGAANDGREPTRSVPRALLALDPGTTTPLAPGDLLPNLPGPDTRFDVKLGVAPPNYHAGAKVQVEVKPSSVLFDGTGLTSSPAFAVPGPSGALSLEVSVPKGDSYHFRARVLLDPNQPIGTQRGPWIYGGLSGQPTSVHLRAPGCPTCIIPPPPPPPIPAMSSFWLTALVILILLAASASLRWRRGEAAD